MELADPITPKEIGALFNRAERITVPSYQRRYSWGDEQLEELWGDLNKLDDGGNHFFGTIVFMSGPHVAGGINEIDVVDGQQRITTISILLCAIRDYLDDNFPSSDTESRVGTINESLWLVDRDGEKQGLRVELGNLDESSYANLIEGRLDRVENPLLENAYQFFFNKLDEIGDLDGIADVHDTVLDQLIYVSITAQGHTDAFHLFEAMNNRGLSLSPIDLMKNYLLMRATEDRTTDEEEVEGLWGRIIRNVDSISNINNPTETFFRQYFMSSPIADIHRKVTIRKLYEPTFIEAIDEADDIIKLLEDVEKQAELYNKLLTQDIDLFNRSVNSEINRYLRDAKTVSITSFTLLLRAFREVEDPEVIKEMIRISNALLTRRQVCDMNTGPHDTIFNHLSHNAFSAPDPLEYIAEYLVSEGHWPTDDQFKRYFAEADFPRQNRTKYILSTIEEDHYGHGGKEVVESRYQVHIEHILPEQPSKSLDRLWLDPYDISEEEHDHYKKKIGNLTLLEEDPNIRASNRSLSKKKEFYSDDKTDFVMTHALLGFDEWGVPEIEQRSEKLAEIAVGAWNL